MGESRHRQGRSDAHGVVKVGLVAGEERREKRLSPAARQISRWRGRAPSAHKETKSPASGDLRRAGRSAPKDALRRVVSSSSGRCARAPDAYRNRKLVARRERGEIFRIVGGDAALHARQVRVSDTHRYVFARIVNVRVVRHAHGDHTLFPGERVRGRGEKMLLHEKGEKPDRRAEQREMRAGTFRAEAAAKARKRGARRRPPPGAERSPAVKGYENGKGLNCPARQAQAYAVGSSCVRQAERWFLCGNVIQLREPDRRPDRGSRIPCRSETFREYIVGYSAIFFCVRSWSSRSSYRRKIHTITPS